MRVGATLARVPTTHPRYTITDTGELRTMLDAAQRRWPEISDRRRLLLKLVEAGADEIAAAAERVNGEALRVQQARAWERSLQYIDVEVLLSDEAWR